MTVDAPRRDRRARGRHKWATPIYVRPSLPHDFGIEEDLETLNVCREGIYFCTSQSFYQRDMRLFVTFPYSTVPGAINRDYIAVVKRVESLESGRYGIAVKLLETLALVCVAGPLKKR